MGYSSEVKAVLGIDTSKMPEDTRRVIDAFKNAAKEIENTSAHTGAGAGEKLVGALEHKLLGARHLSGALATALGLNLESIAEKITSAIVGGTKEGWKEAGEISEKNAELVSKLIESHLTPKQLEEHNKRELTRAIDESGKEGHDSGDEAAGGIAGAASAQLGGRGFGVIKSLLAAFGLGKSDADALKDSLEKQNKVLVAQVKVEEDVKKTREEIKRLDDDELSAREKSGTLKEKEAALQDHIKKLQLDYVNGDYTEVELAKKKLEIKQKENDLENVHKEQRQRALDDEKRLNDLAAKRATLRQQELQLSKDKDRLTDRSKLTVGELANLRKEDPEAAARREEEERRRAFTFGENADLTSEQVSAKEKARKVQDLDADADRARLSGNSGKAADIMGQVGTLREELVKSGFTKSTEGDPAKLLREQIAKDNEQIIKTLGEIATTEKGKFVNQ